MSFENEDMFGNNDNPFEGGNNDNPFGNDNNGDGNRFGAGGMENETDTVTVNVKNVNGEVLSYEIKTSDKIETLINTYKNDIGSNKNAKVIFSFQGKILKESSTFAENNIGSDDTIHSLIRLKGGY